MDNIILIGMPGVGKSTLGVLLAKTLGMTFLDTDLVIQEQEGALLRDLIAARGIEGFLDLEGEVCAHLQAHRTVVATGGIAQFVVPLCKREIKLEKNLLLKGLNLLYKKNKKS